MVHGDGPAQGDILVNGSAEGDIEYLHAAADGKDWKFQRQKIFHQGNMELVCPKIGCPAFRH